MAASHSAVSVALVQEKLEGQLKKQAPVYFVSEVLSLSKKNCWGPSASEGPQKHDLTMFLEYDT
jgi:hypothetical protein